MVETDRRGFKGKLRREARGVGLLLASTTSMIGSGWLFGAFNASKIAGPLSLWSWVIGATIIILIALCFAELAVLFPRSGALVHMSHASHGNGLGRIWGWLLFLAYVAIPPIEAEASVTYANNYLPYFLRPGGQNLLTTTGFVACAALVGVLALLNLLGVRRLLRVNSAVTWWKLAVPVLAAVALTAASTHWDVWSADRGGYRLSGIFTALPAAGIVFSFLGFRTAIDLGGESADPGRNIPLAVIGSVLIAAVLYVALQAAFVLSLRPSDLAGGWANLSFTGEAGPFAGLATMLGLGWLAALLYIDAYISSGGSGLMGLTGGARILYAIGEMGSGPRSLTALNAAGAPWAAVLVMWVAGVVLLLPFPAWQQMVGFITSIIVLTYGLGPVALLVLRRNQPDLLRAFRLRGAGIVAPVAFVSSNWVVYWTGYATNSFLFALVAAGAVVYAGYLHLFARDRAEDFRWRNVGWLAAWFGGLWVLSALSDLGGGYDVLGFWGGVIAVAVWSLIVLALALRSALAPAETAAIMVRIEAMAEGREL